MINNRFYNVLSFTISSANTWTKVSVKTFVGDTSGKLK